MARQVIYGGSDDLIETVGDVEEEFDVLGHEKGWIATSLGVLVRYELDDEGVWRFRLAATYPEPGDRSLHVTIDPARGDGEANDADGCPGYSDKVVIVDDVEEHCRWVALATEYRV